MAPEPRPAPGRTRPARDAAAGVALVEVLVALALFAMIGLAGFTVLDQVVRVQERTEGRLARLAQIQRAMHVLSQDFMLASSASVRAGEGAVSFRRSAGAGEASVRYALEDATLVRRVVGAAGAPEARQELLPGVRDIGWRFLAAGGEWSGSWPPPASDPAALNPAAVAVELGLAGPGLTGALRRVAVLPVDAGP